MTIIDNNYNEVQKVFDFKGSQVRTVIINGEPWFVAKDVCSVLDIPQNTVTVALRKIPTEMKGLYPLQTIKGMQKINCVNESGLYRLVMRSNKPQALQFQNWIASEVLPSLRKHGMYMTNETAKEAIEDTEIFLSRALLIAKEKIDKQQAELEEARPKVEHFDSYMNTYQSHSFSDVAALLNLYVKDFTQMLVVDGILTRNVKGELKPRKAYINTGYFRVKHADKYIHTRVTPAGVQWLLKKYA